MLPAAEMAGTDDESRLERFRAVFVDPAPYDPVAGVDRRYAPALLVRTWVVHALYRLCRGRDAGVYAAFLGALAGRRERLFGGG